MGAKLLTTLSSLWYRNFRLFFVGQAIVSMGIRLDIVAKNWLIYRLKPSPFFLGVYSSLGRIALLLLPFTGVLSDRWNRRGILIACQILDMLNGLILAFLALAKKIRTWQLFGLRILSSILSASKTPARYAFFSEMVKKEDLGNALALDFFLANLARLFGPPLAGILMEKTGSDMKGAGICFFLYALSSIPMLGALLLMRIQTQNKKTERQAFLPEIKTGFSYAWGFVPARYPLLLLGYISLVGLSYEMLIRIFAEETLGGGPKVYGFLLGAIGIGSLFGPIYLAYYKNFLGRWKLIALSGCLLGSALLIFSFTRSFWPAFSALVLAGFGTTVFILLITTVLQEISDDDKRGRLMSCYSLAYALGAFFGDLLLGGLAEKIGTPLTLLVSGVGCILGSLAFARKLPALREMVQPIFSKTGH